MSVATKYRRKITVGSQRYVWYVALNRDGPGMLLYVVSEDKLFITTYDLDQPEDRNHIVVLGPRFAGAKTGGPWRRFLCPRFAGQTVTPRNVRDLIEWCLNEELPRLEVDWRGIPLGT